MRHCGRCQARKPDTDFGKSKSRKGGFDHYCKECRRLASKEWKARNKDKALAAWREWAKENKGSRAEYMRQWRAQNPSKVAASDRKYRYGLTHEQFASMLEKQGGVCVICRGTDKTRSLAVDHCHVTGRVRGLLCGTCNTALGAFERFGSEMAQYLVLHS